MTSAQKILAAHCGRKAVEAGEFINARVDLVMTTDATGLLSVEQFGEMGARRVFDPRKVVFVMDHFVPARTPEAAEVVRKLRRFAMEQGLVWFEAGRSGICHALLPEQGLVAPGDLVVGGDSHTCTYGAVGAFATGMGSTDIAAAMATGEAWLRVPHTIAVRLHGRLQAWVGGKDLILHTIGRIGVDGANYAALEFGGEVVQELEMDDRFTMANMAIEAGAKAGLFPVDRRTREYLTRRVTRAFTAWDPDPDAAYGQHLDVDVTPLEPQVALPHSPGNVRGVGELPAVEIDQAVIGSCTNGRLGDLRTAARVLAGRKVHPRVRCIVVPATPEIYREALAEGLLATLMEAGVVLSPPTCGPCCGGHMGVLAAGERCVSSTNRNFIGRMGSPKAEVYLASPAVAAASAVAGRIVHPSEVMGS
jgi:3-isopropylmalate/(R)-2-methylmalate dehydratase large subunit